MFLIISFITLFGLSSGPVTWVYISEIMQDKSLSIAVLFNCLAHLLISAYTHFLVNMLGIGTIFIIAGVLTVMATIFI